MWDLARAVDADDRSDPGWCALFIDKLPTDPDALSASGMFGHPIAVEGQADAQSRLLARLGRNPALAASRNARDTFYADVNRSTICRARSSRVEAFQGLASVRLGCAPHQQSERPAPHVSRQSTRSKRRSCRDQS